MKFLLISVFIFVYFKLTYAVKIGYDASGKNEGVEGGELESLLGLVGSLLGAPNGISKLFNDKTNSVNSDFGLTNTLKSLTGSLGGEADILASIISDLLGSLTSLTVIDTSVVGPAAVAVERVLKTIASLTGPATNILATLDLKAHFGIITDTVNLVAGTGTSSVNALLYSLQTVTSVVLNISSTTAEVEVAFKSVGAAVTVLVEKVTAFAIKAANAPHQALADALAVVTLTNGAALVLAYTVISLAASTLKIVPDSVENVVLAVSRVTKVLIFIIGFSVSGYIQVATLVVTKIAETLSRISSDLNGKFGGFESRHVSGGQKIGN